MPDEWDGGERWGKRARGRGSGGRGRGRSFSSLQNLQDDQSLYLPEALLHIIPQRVPPPGFLPGSKKHSDKLSTVFLLVSWCQKKSVSDKNPLPSLLSSFFESLPLYSRVTLGLGIYIVRYISQKINFPPFSPLLSPPPPSRRAKSNFQSKPEKKEKTNFHNF